jgi:hypothetical protein
MLILSCRSGETGWGFLLGSSPRYVLKEPLANQKEQALNRALQYSLDNLDMCNFVFLIPFLLLWMGTAQSAFGASVMTLRSLLRLWWVICCVVVVSSLFRRWLAHHNYHFIFTQRTSNDKSSGNSWVVLGGQTAKLWPQNYNECMGRERSSVDIMLQFSCSYIRNIL